MLGSFSVYSIISSFISVYWDSKSSSGSFSMELVLFSGLLLCSPVAGWNYWIELTDGEAKVLPAALLEAPKLW